MTFDVVVVGGGSPASPPRTSCRGDGARSCVLEAPGRAGGVILSEEVDGFTIDGGPDSLLVQKPEAIALCEELGLGDRLVPTKPPRLAYIQRGGRLHPLPAASVLGIPTRIGPFVTHDAVLVAGQAAHGRRAVRPARDATRRTNRSARS